MSGSQEDQHKCNTSLIHLPRNCTLGTVFFHPDVLDLPFLPHLKESAKLSYILAIEHSVDLMIVELRQSLLSTDFRMLQVLFLMHFLLLRHQFLTSVHLLLRARLVAVYVPLMLIIGIILSNRRLCKILYYSNKN